MKFTIVLVVLLSYAFSLNAQDSTVLKRTPYTLKIAVDKKNYYEEELGATQYVFPNNGIRLYPGETIYVAIKTENGRIKSMNAVKEIKDPDSTITIKFTQQATNNIHEMMMLNISNPFPWDLSYKAKMYLLRAQKWVDTDVYPVKAGIAAYETWPDVIISLALDSWKFTGK